MATIYKNVGKKIRKLRDGAGLSQHELALKSRVDLTSISEIESGLRNPSLKTLHKIALALKVPVRKLLEF